MRTIEELHEETNNIYTWENSGIFNYELDLIIKTNTNEMLIEKLKEIKKLRMSVEKVKINITQEIIDTNILTLTNGIEVNINPEWINTWISKSTNQKYKERLLKLQSQKEFDKELLYSHREYNYISKITDRGINSDKDTIFNRLKAFKEEEEK